MAFLESEKNKICTIIGVIPIQINAWLVYNAVNITAQVETDVRNELDRWDAEGGKLVRLTSTESNFGVNTDSSQVKRDIQNNICFLLGLDPSVIGVGSGARLQRS